MATESRRMIQRKGTKAQLPTPTDGEIYISTDTKEMYFGAGGMNKIPTMADIANLNSNGSGDEKYIYEGSSSPSDSSLIWIKK